MKNNKNINILKNINSLIQIFSFLVILFLSIFLKPNAHAHELWLEPVNFNFNNKELFKTNINIGQDFKGSPFGFYSPNKKKLYLENKNEIINLSQRDGNFPAIQTFILGQGFHVLNYETNNEFLKYDSIEKFEDFIKEQGIFNYEYISKLVDNHLSGKEDATFKMWPFYCFQKWYKNIYLN